MTPDSTRQPDLISAPAAQEPATTTVATPHPRRYFLRKIEDNLLFSGERLREIAPVRYELVVELLADGRLSQRQIADILGVSPSTVRAIDIAQTPSIGALRARLLIRAGQIEQTTMERIQEVLDTRASSAMDLRELAAILREIGNRAELLAGRPTQIIGREAGSVDDVAAANATRRARLRDMAIDAEAHIVPQPTPAPPRTRFEGETTGTREAEAGDEADHGTDPAHGEADPEPGEAQASEGKTHVS